MDFLVEQSLRSLLLRRIYRTDVSLVRNDSRTAQLVYAYVQSVSAQVLLEQDAEGRTLEAAKEIYFSIEPLVGLTQGTIRKYIAALWRDDYALKLFLEVKASDQERFDIRAYR